MAKCDSCNKDFRKEDIRKISHKKHFHNVCRNCIKKFSLISSYG